MSAYESIRVQIRLGDLSNVFTAANLYDYVNDEKTKADLEFREGIKDLEAELGKKANEISRLTEELDRVKNENAETNSATAKIVEEWKARLKEYTDANAELQRTIDTLKQEIERTKNRKPREVSPLLRQRIENAKDVLDHIIPVVADCDGSFGEVAGDRFNAVYKTLQELYDVTMAEVL